MYTSVHYLKMFPHQKQKIKKKKEIKVNSVAHSPLWIKAEQRICAHISAKHWVSLVT